MYRVVLALSWALVIVASAAHAGSASSASLDAAVPDTEHLTYLDLVRQIVPDIAVTGDGYEGREIIELRHIGDDPEMAGEPPQTLGPSRVDVLPVHSDGKDRLLLMLDLGQTEGVAASYTVLALFNVAGSPTLVDAALVGYDLLTSFHDPARLSIGDGKDAVLTRSSHFNSNQTYIRTALILIRNDRLQLVDDFFTFHDRGCAYVRDEVIDFRAGDRDARTYSDIIVTARETTEPTDLDCGDDPKPQPGTRTFSVTYRWDEAASKFVPDSDAIDRLEQENMDRL